MQKASTILLFPRACALHSMEPSVLGLQYEKSLLLPHSETARKEEPVVWVFVLDH